MSVSFVSRDLGKAKIESELKKARRLVALVGIPSDSEPEKDSDIPLATIAYINEKGSTEQDTAAPIHEADKGEG